MKLGAFLGANGKQTDDRGDDAARGDDDRRYDRPSHIEAAKSTKVTELGERSRKNRRRKNRASVGFEQVGAHARDVAHVVTYVIGDGSRVARVVLGDARFDLAHQVGAHVSSLCVDTATNTGKQCYSRSAGREALDHAHMLVHERRRIDAEDEQDQPEGKTHKRKGSNAKTHG